MRGLTVEGTAAYGIAATVSAPLTRQGVGQLGLGGSRAVSEQVHIEGIRQVRIKGVEAGGSVGVRATATASIQDVLHLPAVEQALQQAGQKIAGVLNDVQTRLMDDAYRNHR